MAEMTKKEFSQQVTLTLLHSIKDWAPSELNVKTMSDILDRDKPPVTTAEVIRMSQDFLALMVAETSDKITNLTYYS